MLKNNTWEHIIRFLILEDPPKNHLYVITGLLLKYHFIIINIIFIIIIIIIII